MTVHEGVELMLERLRPALNADGGDIELVALEGAASEPAVPGTRTSALPEAGTIRLDGLSLDARLQRVEAELIRAALAETHGNKSQAAARLGVKRSTLGDRIVRCGLE
jgi:DNA-binding NtrC family response regulator